jgi:hypothetical protein
MLLGSDKLMEAEVPKIAKKKKIRENNGGKTDCMLEGSSEIRYRRGRTRNKVLLLRLWKGCRQRYLRLEL